MENRVGKWIICSLVIVMGMGCASKEPTPDAPVMESPPVMAPPPEPEKETVSVTASRLNLRAESTSKSKILHVLDKGDPLTVLTREKGWIQVRNDAGLEGWVSARYTTAGDTLPAEAATLPKAPDQTPQKPPVVVEKPPKSSPKTTAQAPPPPKQTTATTATQAGELTQEEAVIAYRRFRQSLVDGDFEAFVNSIHDPPGPDEANPEEFAMLKGFLLELIPDPAAWEVLKFDRDKEKALLVVRSSLDDPDNITLTPLFFFPHEGQWKMEFETSPETLPRQDPQADQANIAKALETNPALQLSGAPSVEPEPAETTQSEASPPPPVPTENGVAAGEMVVNGEATELHYAYAYPEKSLSDPNRVNTIVILANTKLDFEALDSWARRSELEDIGKLFCIELTLNPKNQVISRRLRHHAFDGSPSGVSYLEKFESHDAGKGIIAGQAYSTAEGEFFGVTYQYRAAFRAEIKAPEKPAESEQAGQTSAYTVARPPKEDLTRVPRYMKDAASPVFKALKAQTAVGQIKVVSNRGTALFGFNTPEVVVYLPPFSNSAYAVVEFDDPHVVDAQGGPVPFELESGGYNDDTFSAEIRITPKEGDDLVEFARVKGTGRIKYPLRVDTQHFKPGQAGADVEFDGPYITYTQKNDPDMPFTFTDTGPVRAYDATGGRLREGGYSSTSMQNNITRKTVAYRGSVTEIQVDSPQEWVDIEFTFDLPPMAPKPGSHAGRSATRPDPIVETPDGKVTVKLVDTKQGKGKMSVADNPNNTELSAPVVKKYKQEETDKLFSYIARGDVESVKYLLQGGMSPDVRHSGGIPYSPLYYAVVSSRQDIAILLIKAGADIEFKDQYGVPALHRAMWDCKMIPLVQALIDAGADVNAKANDGETPLEYAKKNGCQAMEKNLINAGAK